MLTTECPAELFGGWDFHVTDKFNHVCAQAPFSGESDDGFLNKNGGCGLADELHAAAQR